MGLFHRDSAKQTAEPHNDSDSVGGTLSQFDVGMLAEEASRVGNVQEADRLYRKAFDIPDERGDDGWLTGSYCTFLREQNRTEEAFRLLRKATDGGIDIPLLWFQLIDILVDRRDLDAIMDVANTIPPRVVPQDRVASWLLTSAKRRDADLDFSERLCQRAREYALSIGDRSGEWQIIGQLGQIMEKSGRVDEAIGEWQKAFDAGSDDPTTAVRLSMALDKAKRYEDAARVIQSALKRGLPASSEENLKKRLARLETRQSPTKARKDVTAFSIRFGDGFLKLLYQIRLKPTLKELVVLNGVIRAHCAAKDINELVRINLRTGEETARSLWPDIQSHLLAPDGWALGEKNPPKVGSGTAQLFFFGQDDVLVSTKEIPDSTSGIANASGQWYVGCRDGRLYCFDRQGNLKWNWTTPGADEPVDNVYFRPCPYYVTATDEFVTFSSWGNLFALSKDGKLLWHRDVPSQGPIIITVPLGGSLRMDSWRVLGLSQGASDEDIRRAYRKLALNTHPDRNPDDAAAAEHFRMIQSAYESLLAAPHQTQPQGVVRFTITMPLSVSRLFALNNEIVVVSSDGVLTFLDADGEVKSRRVLGRSAAEPVFDKSGILRAAYCDQILSFFEGEAIVNATELEGNPVSVSLWGDDVVVASRIGLTVFNRYGIKLWTVEFSKRLASFFAVNDLLVCSAGALIVFERVTDNP
jgi:tetratricopeptide (TPR) repeat protein